MEESGAAAPEVAGTGASAFRPALRVAVAGTGFIGAVHARSARLAGARLVGVAASTPERSRAAAARLGAERAFGAAEELVAAKDVDVVHLCTPNHLHAPLAEAALAAGKHVVCEKPLAASAPDAERLAALAAAHPGRLAAVPFVYRYYPVVREARARVAAGEAGELRLIHGTYLQDWLSVPEDDNWRVDPDLGGASRAFADIGSHWCDLAEFVSGERIAALSAQAVTLIGERSPGPGRHAFARAGSGSGSAGAGARRAVGTEDAATVQLRTTGGAVGTLMVSQVSPGRKNALRLEISGSQATYHFDQEHPETLWAGGRDHTEIVARDGASLAPSAAPYATLPPGHPQGYHDCFDLFVADAYRAIAAAAPDGLPTFADGARAARITQAVLDSSAAGAWVEVA